MSEESPSYSVNEYTPVNKYIDEQSRYRQTRTAWAFSKIVALYLIALGIFLLLLGIAYWWFTKPHPEIVQHVIEVQPDMSSINEQDGMIIDDQVSKLISIDPNKPMDENIQEIIIQGNDNIEKLDDEIEKLKEEKKALDNELANDPVPTKDEIKNQEEIVDNLKEDIEIKKDQIADLENQPALDKKIEKQEELVKQLENDIKIDQSTVDTLEEQLPEQIATKDEIKDQEAIIEELEDEISLTEEELNNLNEQPDLDANQKDEMVSNLQDALNEKQEELQNEQVLKDEMENSILNEEAYNNAVVELEANEEELSKEQDRLENLKDIQEKNPEYIPEDYQQELDDEKEILAEMQDEYNDEKSELDRLKNKEEGKKRSKKLNDEIKEKEIQKENTEVQLAQAEEMLNQLRVENEKLLQEMQEQNQILDDEGKPVAIYESYNVFNSVDVPGNDNYQVTTGFQWDSREGFDKGTAYDARWCYIRQFDPHTDFWYDQGSQNQKLSIFKISESQIMSYQKYCTESPKKTIKIIND